MLPTRPKRAALWRASAVMLSSVVVGGCPGPDPSNIIDPPKYTVVVGPITSAAPGGTGSLDLYVVRADGFNQAITIAPAVPQAAIQWAALTIAAGVTEATLPFTVPTATTAGVKLILIIATTPGERDVQALASVPVTAAGTFLFSADPGILVGNPGMTLFREYRAARNGMTAPITISVQASPGITAILPFTQLAAGEETGNVELRIPVTTAPGDYTVVLRASSPPLADQTVTLFVTVTNRTFTVSLDESAVWVPQGGSAQVVPSVVPLNGYINGVAFTATSPPGIGVTVSGPFNPVLTVAVGPAVAPGVYPVTITGTGQGTTPKTAQLTVNVLPNPTGAPAAVHIEPASASVRVDGTQVYVAILRDAAGNRALKAPDGDIEIVTVSSGIANVISGGYYAGQREQRAVVKGLAAGTTDVRAYYRVGGVRVIGPVASPLTVTP